MSRRRSLVNHCKTAREVRKSSNKKKMKTPNLVAFKCSKDGNQILGSLKIVNFRQVELLDPIGKDDVVNVPGKKEKEEMKKVNEQNAPKAISSKCFTR